MLGLYTAQPHQSSLLPDLLSRSPAQALPLTKGTIFLPYKDRWISRRFYGLLGAEQPDDRTKG
jgi:hypothetical protein